MKTQTRNLLSCLAIILISSLLLSACAEKQLEELIEQQEEETKLRPQKNLSNLKNR